MTESMYVSVRNVPSGGPTDPGGGGRSRRLLSATLVGLGLTSFFTDISSEMIASILPLYLTVQLGFTPSVLGLVDGLLQVFTAILRPIGGLLADRRRRYQELATGGYALSGLSKLGLVVLGGGLAPLMVLLFIDKIGKGVRTAPRDALVSLSVSPDRLATAFGFHRTLDTAGALAGPLLASVLLDRTNQRLDSVVVWSFLFAVMGVAMMVLFVRNPAPAPAAVGGDPDGANPPRLTYRLGLQQSWRLPGFRRFALAAAALGAATVGDSFIYLAVQRQRNLEARFFPLLFAGAAVSYLLLALPIGRLADRFGRLLVFRTGYVALLAAYGVVISGRLGAVGTLVLLGLLGAYYAATDGVLAAVVSGLTPVQLRTTGIAAVTAVVALSRFGSSLVVGQLWDRVGVRPAFATFAVVLTIAWLVARALVQPLERSVS